MANTKLSLNLHRRLDRSRARKTKHQVKRLGEKPSRFFHYLTVVAACATIATLMLNATNSYRGLYMEPRAKLTVSISSVSWSSSDVSSSISVLVEISNYSPRKANILPDLNLTLVFENSTFEFPDQNCTFGTRILEPAQQTEFIFSFDITNSTLLNVNDLKRMIFTISYIDDQGTQQQQFEFIRPHS